LDRSWENTENKKNGEMLWQCQAHCVTGCGTLNSAIYMTRKLVFAFKKNYKHDLSNVEKDG